MTSTQDPLPRTVTELCQAIQAPQSNGTALSPPAWDMTTGSHPMFRENKRLAVDGRNDRWRYSFAD